MINCDETFRNAKVYYDFWNVLNSGLLAALVALFVTVHVMLCRYFEGGCCIFLGSSRRTENCIRIHIYVPASSR